MENNKFNKSDKILFCLHIIFFGIFIITQISKCNFTKRQTGSIIKKGVVVDEIVKDETSGRSQIECFYYRVSVKDSSRVQRYSVKYFNKDLFKGDTVTITYGILTPKYKWMFFGSDEFFNREIDTVFVNIK